MQTPIPPTMRAAVYRSRGVLAVEERPLPELGMQDVLLRVSHCGVCGTDLHLVMDGWGRPNSIGGHEFSGEVVAAGSGVEGWQLGDRAVGGPAPSCGECACCQMGRPSLCANGQEPGMGEFQGAFADYVRVSADQLVRVPRNLTLRESALAEPVAVALHGVTRGSVQPGMRVLVSGAGPIGALILSVLKARGIEEITLSEPSPVRRELGRALGARCVVEPEELPIPKLPTQQVAAPFDVAFECSGKGAAIQACVANLARAGRLVILGTGMESPRLDPTRVLLSELVVTGAYNYDAGGFDAALALLASGVLPTDLLIEPGEVPLEGLLDAMSTLAAGNVAGKVMVVPGV